MGRARLLRMRILLRSLRFRLMKAVGRATTSEGPRDLYIHPRDYKIRFAPEQGLSYYHLYTRREFLEDTRASGLTIEAVYSSLELNQGYPLPSIFKDLDFLLFYVLQK